MRQLETIGVRVQLSQCEVILNHSMYLTSTVSQNISSPSLDA